MQQADGLLLPVPILLLLPLPDGHRTPFILVVVVVEVVLDAGHDSTINETNDDASDVRS